MNEFKNFLKDCGLTKRYVNFLCRQKLLHKSFLNAPVKDYFNEIKRFTNLLKEAHTEFYQDILSEYIYFFYITERYPNITEISRINDFLENKLKTLLTTYNYTPFLMRHLFQTLDFLWEYKKIYIIETAEELDNLLHNIMLTTSYPQEHLVMLYTEIFKRKKMSKTELRKIIKDIEKVNSL